MTYHAFSGLALLDTAVLALNQTGEVQYANQAAQTLLGMSEKELLGKSFRQCFYSQSAIVQAMTKALTDLVCVTEPEILLESPRVNGYVSFHAAPAEVDETLLIVELRQIDQHRKIANEERIIVQQQANRELIRNLAHEIKNPLGGIRGAAQLLEHELPDSQLREYTSVITGEVDRLQSLLDRLLTPHNLPQVRELNIHEVLEWVRNLVLVEVPNGLSIRRDYDISLPSIIADKEQLIQAVLNIVRNAVQAMHGVGEIILRSRIAHQVTINRQRHHLAIYLDIIDNGPGILPYLKDRLFYPLVTGRADGTGIGLHLAQTYITQHHGIIEFESEPGFTCFTIILPTNPWEASKTGEAL